MISSIAARRIRGHSIFSEAADSRDSGTFYFFGDRVTEIRHENASATILAA